MKIFGKVIFFNFILPKIWQDEICLYLCTAMPEWRNW